MNDAQPQTPEVNDDIVGDDVLPHGKLPPLRSRDLPEPVPLLKMIGPSIMLSGLALGSGEFIFWPYITYQSQFVFFWACVLGVTTQYFINMEITRWSLATGESAITGFARLSKHWAWIFLFLNIIPWMVPAWSKGAAQVFGWLIWGENVNEQLVTYLSIAGLVACGSILTLGKVVYETVEKIQMFLVALAMLLVIGLSIFLVRPDAISAQVAGALNFGALPDFSDQLTPALLLGALAFAGVGGTLNLGQSNYVKDKGYGMGKYIGRITSPITGQEEAISEIGYHFPHTEGNLSRWRGWWRAANIEHFLTFFLTCLVSLVLLTLISYCIFYGPDGTLLPEAGKYDKGIEFVRGEAVEIDRIFGTTIKVLFLIMGMAFLLTTEFGVLDASTRVSTDIIKVNWLRENTRWSESRLYYLYLWGIIAIGVVILLNDEIGTFGLFKFAAAMNGLVMFIYCGLLLYVNRFRLPQVIRMSWPRVLIMAWATLFFGYFAVWTVWNFFRA